MLGLGLSLTNPSFVGGGFTGLLDEYSGAAAAYSLRRLSGSYTGPAIKVRNKATQAITDIGFDANGDLDMTALAAASLNELGETKQLGVVTWYDQSGNGNDATQSSGSAQPNIYLGSGPILENGKPIIQTSSGAYLDVSAALNASNPTTQFIAGKSGISGAISNTFYAGGNRYILASKQGDTANTFIIPPDASYLNGSSFTFTDRDNTYNNTTAQSLISLYWANPSHSSLIKIGWTSTSWAMWSTQELIIYNNNQSSNISGIETNINDYYSIYP